MTLREAPAWLAEYQSLFGALLRTPLDRATGSLRAPTEGYDEALLAQVREGPFGPARERLAVYHRQYWFRLFRAFHVSFPLTARLLGFWECNGYAARFLEQSPPRGWDLERVAEGFDRWLSGALAEHPQRELLLEAAAHDALHRGLLRAPPVAPFRPTAEEAATLLLRRLVRAPGAAVFTERWALTLARGRLRSLSAEERLEAPAPWPAPVSLLLLREEGGLRSFALEAEEALLLALLEEHPVGEALALLEGRCAEGARAALPARARAWLARGVQRGVWSGATG